MTRREKIVSAVQSLGLFAAVVAIVLGVFSITVAQHKAEARAALGETVDRMRAVGNPEDDWALLGACRTERVQCRMTDYPVTYKGHHLQASWFEASYLVHFDDVGTPRTSLYTVQIHIERKPRIDMVSYDF